MLLINIIIFLFFQAIDKVRDNAVLYTNRAQTHIKLGHYPEALKDCDWAIMVSNITNKKWFKI